jgi:hypothetical protein
MHKLKTAVSSLLSLLRPIDLNTPRSVAIARVLVPVFFGIYSLWLGADANWDLYNYHMYNPFAWLHDKLLVDFAPAGVQSYFNPLLDVSFYLANTYLPSRIVGFFMGALHGTAFVLLLAIAQNALPDLSEENRYRVPLLLALAGCLTANFLSGLGNSMGDDTTALFSLGALALLMHNWKQLGLWSGRATAITLAAGFIVGLGTGIKLTNAVFAVAMSLALLFYPAGAAVKLRMAFLFGVGLLAGFALTAGFWMYHLWKTFGNPLYPLFGSVFPNPMARPDFVGDPRWRPHGWFETTFWPYVFTADSKRLGEIRIRQIIWSIVYTLFWVWVAVRASSWIMRRKAFAAIDTRARFILLFVAFGYLLWMQMFSLYRYIVTIEVLTPLVVWILMHQLLPNRNGERIAGVLLAAASVVVMAGGARTAGHEDWADPLWHAEVPEIAQPEATTVMFAMVETTAHAWLATRFPDTVAFAHIDSSFPATRQFNNHVRNMTKRRGGPIFAIFEGKYNRRAESVTNTNQKLDFLGLTDSDKGCERIRWAVKRFRVKAVVSALPGTTKKCELVARAEDTRDVDNENRRLQDIAVRKFARNGYALNTSTCKSYSAGIGDGRRAYQWCQVSLIH